MIAAKAFRLFLSRCSVALISLGVFLPQAAVLASDTDGTISSTNRYAWGENIGWIDFGTTNGNVHVTDAGLSGSALTENVGWIVLDDVTNNGEGVLSGYAWGENVGWIKFDPTNGGVTISSSGVFAGEALGENIGWIIFDTDNPVTTDWRPSSSRVQVEATPSPSSSGGGSLPPAAYEPVQAPIGGFGISLNGNAASTALRGVTVTLRGGPNTRAVKLSEQTHFPEGFQVSYPAGANQTVVSFTLSAGDGPKVVHAQFCTEWGQCSSASSDEIILASAPAPSVIDQVTDLPGQIVEEVQEIGDILKPILPPVSRPTTTPRPPSPSQEPSLPADVTVPEEAPPSLQAIWDLSPTEALETFTQGSLPARLLDLAQKFPVLEQTLQRLGINTVGDVGKLRGVRLTLATLTERLGLSAPLPVSELSDAMKAQMPTDVVFARVGGQLIDLGTTFSVSEQGGFEQSVNTIVGKSLHLAIKPEDAASGVKGYLAFRANDTQPVSEGSHTFLSGLFGIAPVRAQSAPAAAPVVEERMLLQAFTYTDPDRDGIYTADIEMPEVPGEYEIITVIDFVDADMGRKELRLITVVDPEGYVYETRDNKQTRIPGAVVSLYWLDPSTNEYTLWDAGRYQQRNPQTTDLRGTYSFLVPPGYYYLKTEAAGYPVNESKPFEVVEGSGVHMNIELKSEAWKSFMDWKTILLLAVTALLLVSLVGSRRKKSK